MNLGPPKFSGPFLVSHASDDCNQVSNKYNKLDLQPAFNKRTTGPFISINVIRKAKVCLDLT